MDKNIITALKEHMQEVSSRVNLKVRLQEEDQFLQIQLINKDNIIVYKAYEVNEIISFVQGVEYATTL